MFGSRLTRDGRMMFPFAIAEAQDLGHSSLRPEHLILGVLCNGRDPVRDLLADHNITLESARSAVRSATGQGQADPTAEEDRYAQDREALKTLGIDLDTVRAAVRKNFGDDLASGWGHRDDRRGPPTPSRSGRGERGHRGGPHGRRRGSGDCGPIGGPGGRDRDAWDREDWDREEWGPWDYGRGRRGPRGHGRRPRFAPATKELLSAAMNNAARSGDSGVSTAHIVLAALAVDDPAVAAIFGLAPDIEALRQTLIEHQSADATA